MIKSWGWKGGSGVKGASCSCKGPKFHFHHPCQVPITATPKDPAPSSGCQENLHSCAHASKQTCINTCILFLKIFYKKSQHALFWNIEILTA